MKKIKQKIALIFIVIILANIITGCTSQQVFEYVTKPIVHAIVDPVVDSVSDGVSDAVEKGRYKKAAETLIQYDEVDTF